MVNSTGLGCILVLLVTLQCLGIEAFIPRIIHGRPTGGMLRGPIIQKKHFSGYKSDDLWFTQKLDHFTPSDTRTWKQRYFINKSFFKPGGPIFLMIGGEGEVDPIWMTHGDWIENAKRYNAFCIQVEHRYYGKSHPTADMSTENLKYLSSMQALADLAHFRKSITNEYGFTNNKWISFGGSYPGSLSAWFRLKYPHLVNGAVASSAPVNAVLNFKGVGIEVVKELSYICFPSAFGHFVVVIRGYLNVVKSALDTIGGPQCSKKVREATLKVTELLKTDAGKTQLKKMFSLCDYPDVSNRLDMANLFSSFSGNFEGVVQYNKDNRKFEGAVGTNITVDTLCNIMVKDTTLSPIERYAKINQMLLDTYKQKCLDFKYDNMIKDLKKTAWNSSAAEGGRQWLYQTCTEFGYFQSSDSDTQPFGHNFPVDFSVQICKDIFGAKFNASFIEQGIQWTNSNYGALKLSETNIVLPNGSIDPWHALGILKSLSNDTVAIYIDGTAHCANMYPSSPNDNLALALARVEISRLVGKWCCS